MIPVSGESTTPAGTGILPMLKAVRGQKFFELSNHLGNVLVSITDQKTWTVDATNGNYYQATVISATDYYAFGVAIQGRKLQPQGYRYGFNGKENDGDWGTALVQDYGMRVSSPSTGRFLSVDPIAKKYPELSTYQFASNRPLDGTDLDGLEYADATGKNYFYLKREEIRELQKAGITIHSTTLIQIDYGYIYHAAQNVNHYTVLVTQAGNWTDNFRPQGNDSKPISYSFTNFEIEYKYDYDSEGRWGKEEAFQFKAAGHTDMDGVGGASSDASGNGQNETSYGGPTIDALTDRYLALPDKMFADDPKPDIKYGVRGGDISVLRYNNTQSVAAVLDKSRQKLGEHSAAVNTLDFHVPIAKGTSGIDARTVLTTVFRNTTSGSAPTGEYKGKPTGTRPALYNSTATQDAFKALEQAINNVKQ